MKQERIYMSSIKKNTRPLIFMDKDREISNFVSLLLFCLLWVAFYPLLLKLGRYLCHYGNYCLVITFVLLCISYLLIPDKNRIVFRMDEGGIYFLEGKTTFGFWVLSSKPLYFEWSKLKQVSIKAVRKRNGRIVRLLNITTQNETEYCFDIFNYVVSYFWTKHRLKQCVNNFSKGEVPFKCYHIWNKSS